MEAIGFTSNARDDFEYGEVLRAFIATCGSYGTGGTGGITLPKFGEKLPNLN